MKGTDLKPKSKPLYLKIFYFVLLFLVIFLAIFYLYGFLWQKFSGIVARSLTRGFYMEQTGVACNNSNECLGACVNVNKLGGSNECLCLKKSCVYVENANQFAESKYCQRDSDCTVSCYEGPVSKFYYDSVGGDQEDCSEGCKTFSQRAGEKKVIEAICENSQCRYTSDRTCFIGSMNK